MSNIKGNKSHILTTEEKRTLVNDYRNGLTIKELATKFNISYSAARAICIKFDEQGKNGLVSKQGKHLKNKSLPRINSSDPKDREIARLKKIEKEYEVLKKFIDWAEKKNSKIPEL